MDKLAPIIGLTPSGKKARITRARGVILIGTLGLKAPVYNHGQSKLKQAKVCVQSLL